jgi:curved DNA-binding protein
MKEINEAYAVLSDAQKRARYDTLRDRYGTDAHDHFRQRYSEQDIFRNSDINQIFEEMARTFGFRGFEEVFREYQGGHRAGEFRGPGVCGRVIFFGPDFGRPRAGAQVGGKDGASLLARMAGRLGRYALQKILGARNRSAMAPTGGLPLMRERRPTAARWSTSTRDAPGT